MHNQTDTPSTDPAAASLAHTQAHLSSYVAHHLCDLDPAEPYELAHLYELPAFHFGWYANAHRIVTLEPDRAREINQERRPPPSNSSASDPPFRSILDEQRIPLSGQEEDTGDIHHDR